MQSDWTNNDSDWQLKKLQHDSLKTAEKVVEAMRETIEKEVLAQAKDYERLFGSRSAQFAEYLTMVAQKLEQHGVQHANVINWLNSAASEGSVPADYATDLRDSQSKTVPFIDGGPMHDFGEQSLLDKSLGNQGAASPRPTGSMPQPFGGNPATAQAVTSPFPAYGSEAGQGNGNEVPGNGNGYPPPGQTVPIPRQTPVSMPVPGSMPSPMPMPMPVKQAMPSYQQAGLPPHAPMPPNQAQPQPNFNQAPSFSQPPVPTPNPAPPNQFAQAPARRDDKKEDDKYVFDPFTAWD